MNSNKRIMALISFLLFFTVLTRLNYFNTINAKASEIKEYGAIIYTEYDDYIEITDCDENISLIEIPSSINNKPVEMIGAGAFKDCTSLSSIIIPDTIISIDDLAFSNCSSLIDISIPDSVEYIGGDVFVNSGLYHDYSNWHKGLLYIDNRLIIAEDDFSGQCEIREGTKSIASCAFDMCDKLTSVYIPYSVIYVPSNIFYGCKALKTIYVDENNENYSSLNGVLFNKNKTKLIKYPENKTDKSYSIPNSVEYIDDFAFVDCCFLESLSIPNTVTSVGNKSFKGCISLQRMTIPASVTYIGWHAFDDCKSLITIDVNDNNERYSSLNGVLFDKDKTTLIKYPEKKEDKSYSIPNSVEFIGDCAFINCNLLENIDIPKSVKSIGYSAFSSCKSINIISIPNSIKNIGANAFDDCEKLSSIIYYGEEDNWTNIYPFQLPNNITIKFINLNYSDYNESIKESPSITEKSSEISNYSTKTKVVLIITTTITLICCVVVLVTIKLITKRKNT